MLDKVMWVGLHFDRESPTFDAVQAEKAESRIFESYLTAPVSDSHTTYFREGDVMKFLRPPGMFVDISIGVYAAARRLGFGLKVTTVEEGVAKQMEVTEYLESIGIALPVTIQGSYEGVTWPVTIQEPLPA